METELIEMPKGLMDAIKHVLRISETPGPNGPMVDLIAAIDACVVKQVSPDAQAVVDNA